MARQFRGEKRVFPENFHALYDRAFKTVRGVSAAPSTGVEPALARFRADVPDLIVSFDQGTQVPNRISRRQPNSKLTEPMPGSPADATLRFIRAQRDLWSLSPEDVESIYVLSVSLKGLNTVNLIQRIEGKEVFNSEVTIAITPRNEVISVAGQFFPGASAARATARAASEVPAEQAIAKAIFDLAAISYKPAAFSQTEARSPDDPYRFYNIPETLATREDAGVAFDRPIRVKDVMFPLGGTHFVPGYYMEIWIRGFPAFSYVVDTVGTPDVLFRNNLTASVSFSYRVHNTGDEIRRPHDGPAPGTPHPTGLPDGFQAPTILEQLIQIESLLPGDAWLPADAATTNGNNCRAYADLVAPQGQNAGDVDGQVTAPRVFDYTYDHAQPASATQNLQNSIVGMFFHVNWLHDRWHEAGFDEAAGNAQQDNYGRGGLDGDPILAEGNDFSGTDNANMATPADGASPRMQMFEFLGPTPDQPSRTSNHEALITFHEMGHYVTNRLVANANGLTNRQGRAMGEGWGDFFAICMTSQNADNFADGVFAVGGWTDLTPTFNNNYYFSIRRYPYTADMTKDPLTFRHISAGVVLPADPPINPNVGGGNNAVHNAGEVWCSALWEVFVNLVAIHGHREAESRMLAYVIGGLKLTPAQPTFLDARDGIIDAVSALRSSDLLPVWSGFAKRGMGINAVAPASTSTDLTGVVESFEIPAGLAVTAQWLEPILHMMMR